MIVDTMGMAYALLGVSRYRKESLQALRVADRILAPDSIRAELLNVTHKWIVAGEVDPAEAVAAYEDAETVYTEVISAATLWRDALALSLEKKHSPYDTLFVAAARQNRCRVITYDKPLLRLFPDDTITPSAFLKTH